MAYKAGSVVSLMMLVLLCGGLAVVVALEWLNPPQANPPQPAAPPDQIASGLEIEPQGSLEIPPLSQYSEIIERPLFASSRRPPEEPQETIEAEAPEEDTAFTLLGVLITPERATALLQIDEQGVTARVALGETVKGWKLESARANSVTLRKEEITMKLPLVRNRPTPKKEAKVERRQAIKIPTAEELEALKKAAAAGLVPKDAPEEAAENQQQQ